MECPSSSEGSSLISCCYTFFSQVWPISPCSPTFRILICLGKKNYFLLPGRAKTAEAAAGLKWLLFYGASHTHRQIIECLGDDLRLVTLLVLFEVHLFALARHFSQGLKEHIQKCLWDNNNNKITAVMIVIIPIDNLKIKLTPWCFTAINSQNKAQCRDGYGLGAQWAVWDRSLCFSISITR